MEVVKQENQQEGVLHIDFEKAKEKGSLVIKEKSWYGNLLYLGEEAGSSIFTFTNKVNQSKDINPPSREYLFAIISGLKETYNLNNEEIASYFKDKVGIKGFEIAKLIP